MVYRGVLCPDLCSDLRGGFVGKLSTSSAPVYVGVLYRPWSNQGAKASMSHGCSGHPRMPFSDSDKPVDSFVLVRAGVWVAARGENAPVDSPESLRGIPMRGAAWVIPKDSSRCTRGRVAPSRVCPEGLVACWRYRLVKNSALASAGAQTLRCAPGTELTTTLGSFASLPLTTP